MSTINILNDKALTRAREKIRDQFHDPRTMEEISAIQMTLEKKLAAAESQLNSAVQSKLDALKRVVDLMDESTTKVFRAIVPFDIVLIDFIIVGSIH